MYIHDYYIKYNKYCSDTISGNQIDTTNQIELKNTFHKEFIVELFLSVSNNQIDSNDFHIIEKLFGMNFDNNFEKRNVILNELDMKHTGYIDKNVMLNWLNNTDNKKHISKLQKIINYFQG